MQWCLCSGYGLTWKIQWHVQPLVADRPGHASVRPDGVQPGFLDDRLTHPGSIFRKARTMSFSVSESPSVQRRLVYLP